MPADVVESVNFQSQNSKKAFSRLSQAQKSDSPMMAPGADKEHFQTQAIHRGQHTEARKQLLSPPVVSPKGGPLVNKRNTQQLQSVS